MSISPRRRRGVNRVAGSHVRQISAGYHEGDHRDFLRRHELEANVAARGTRQQRNEFARCLLRRASDPRNLMCAIENLTREDDKSPGPNDVRLEQLNKHERWQLARELGRTMRDGTYRTGPVRRQRIEKSSGVGFRTLEIPNAEDKVAQRAIAQVIQPFLDPNFDERSFGFRPHRGRENALAMAQILTERFGYWTWITQDLANAFTQVPHERLADILRLYGLPNDLVALILQAIGNRHRKGLPQGGPLSPILLNVYVDHLLDSPWQRLRPETPLIRVADDLLVLCRNEPEAQEVHAQLAQLTRSAAMPLKYARGLAIRQLDDGQQADWLGYSLTQGDRGLEARIISKSWESLSGSIEHCQDKPHPTLRATDTVLGWFDSLGPTYPHEDRDHVITRVRDTARTWAFEELPPSRELEEAWASAYARFRCMRRAYALSLGGGNNGDAIGSARKLRDSADLGRGSGAPAPGAPLPTFSDQIKLFTDGSCQRNGVGGWAYIVDGPGHSERQCRAGSCLRATNNRMELMAVIEGLDAIERASRVQITTDSRYVAEGLTNWLAHWRHHNWRRVDGGRLANQALWQRLASLIDRHQVSVEWVRGHVGHPQNEECDAMANAAMGTSN